jgi:hypothetical protein
MTIKELIDKETGKSIFCYKQGAFWVCYEQSAYLVCFSRAYTPVKKFIKNCNQEVVTIGFPNSALEQWIDENTIETIEKSERTITLISKQDFDYDDFESYSCFDSNAVFNEAAFSALKSLSYHQFNYWLKKYNKKIDPEQAKPEVSFFSVAEHPNKEKKQSVSKLTDRKTMQINLSGGITITIY